LANDRRRATQNAVWDVLSVSGEQAWEAQPASSFLPKKNCDLGKVQYYFMPDEAASSI
jgi:hypothetical protein